MIPSKEGNIDALKKKKGRAKGACDVWITQKNGDVFTTVGVVVELHPRKSVGELFERYEKWYPDHQQQPLTLGIAKGFATYNASFLAFECRKPDKIPSEIKDRGVSVRVLLPDHPDGLNVDRGKLAKGAGELAAETARYLHSELLKCSGAPLPDGVPALKKP